MRPRIAFILSFSIVAAAAVLIVTKSASNARADAAKTPWKITGQLEEACSCDGACPCWWGNHPTKMTCSGSEALFIDKGSYSLGPALGLAIGGIPAVLIAALIVKELPLVAVRWLVVVVVVYTAAAMLRSAFAEKPAGATKGEAAAAN